MDLSVLNNKEREDLVVGKLYAILSEPRKQDIYYLYFLAQEFGLTEMMTLFARKTTGSTISEPVILKALNDLEDVEDEPIKLIRDVSWQEVKDFWYREVEKYVNKYLQA